MPVPVDLVAQSAGAIRLRAGAATSAGNRRTLNEDAHATTPRWCLVADGMGGHAAGDVASSTAVDAICRVLGSRVRVAVADVRDAVAEANAAIRDRAERDGTPGMGTTVVGAVVVDDDEGGASVAIVHLGDSRCYRLSSGVLDLVTTDHSLVQELLDAGRITPDEAATHPMSNVVTRALGVDERVEPAVVSIGARPGRLLLCSDGLSDELPARTIGRVLAGIADPLEAARRLVELGLAGPARDNLTAVVVDVVEADDAPAANAVTAAATADIDDTDDTDATAELVRGDGT